MDLAAADTAAGGAGITRIPRSGRVGGCLPATFPRLHQSEPGERAVIHRLGFTCTDRRSRFAACRRHAESIAPCKRRASSDTPTIVFNGMRTDGADPQRDGMAISV
jgi:hypothetical protein